MKRNLSRRRKGGQNGFTLLEVLVAILLVSVGIFGFEEHRLSANQHGDRRRSRLHPVHRTVKRPTMRNRSLIRRSRQFGFSIIELMVALTIALFIVGAVLLMYLNMKSTFTTQDSLAQLQDSERLSLTMLTTTIQSAGYFVNPLTSTAITALPAATVTRQDGTSSVFSAAQPVVGSGDGSGTGANSDSIAVRFQTSPTDGLMNCQGATNTTSGPVVSYNSFAVNAKNEFTCTVGTGNEVVLGSNVFQMKVLYGVDTNGDGDMDTYMPASGMTSALWASVYTAQISLTFLDTTASKPGSPIAMPKPVVQTINLMNRQ